MAARKKKKNWAAIKTLYLTGSTPLEIEAVYDVTSKQVRDKAYRDGWGDKKTTICDKIVNDVQEDLRSLCNVTIRVHTDFMLKLQSQMDQITNPYLFDGERTNSIYQTAMNNSVKLTLNALKEQETEADVGASSIEITFVKPDANPG